MTTNAKPLIVAWDGSVPSRHAFDHALELAKVLHQPLRLISVIELPQVYGGVGAGEIDPKLIADQRASQQQLVEVAKVQGVECSGDVLIGVPAEQLIEAARSSDASAMFIGHTEKNLLMRWLLGSVSHSVLDEARIPVTLVP